MAGLITATWTVNNNTMANHKLQNVLQIILYHTICRQQKPWWIELPQPLYFVDFFLNFKTLQVVKFRLMTLECAVDTIANTSWCTTFTLHINQQFTNFNRWKHKNTSATSYRNLCQKTQNLCQKLSNLRQTMAKFVLLVNIRATNFQA